MAGTPIGTSVESFYEPDARNHGQGYEKPVTGTTYFAQQAASFWCEFSDRSCVSGQVLAG